MPVARKGAWAGFAALLAAALGGYVPDAALILERRAARTAGLVDLGQAPPAPPPLDAHRALLEVVSRSSVPLTLLQYDGARQRRRADPSIPPYLRAMAEASRRSLYDRRVPEEPLQDFEFTLGPALYCASLATVQRASGEGQLLAAVRMARHMVADGTPESCARWPALLSRTLDRARALGIPKRRIAEAFGAAPDLRSALKRRVAVIAETFEKRPKRGRWLWRARDLWTEAAFLRAWRGTLGERDLARSLRANADRVTSAEARLREAAFLGARLNDDQPARWADATEAIARAQVRLEGER